MLDTTSSSIVVLSDDLLSCMFFKYFYQLREVSVIVFQAFKLTLFSCNCKPLEEFLLEN